MSQLNTPNTRKKRLPDKLILKEECYRIIGACINVYKDKGCGFLEPVYQESLEIEFEYQGILAVPQKPFPLVYRGRPLKHQYKPDFVCLDSIILEIKAVSALIDEHRAQVINYLKATRLPLGLLVNFGHYPLLEWERILNLPGDPDAQVSSPF
jgi:GxxExxY protein